jgi:hypothetical protein
MAPRATGFAKKPPVAETERVDVRIPVPEPEYFEPDPVPIDLAPLVAPYRRRGRVTVRVERLPHRARLSRGQNNGDRSWSLALDELDGLSYLPADSADEIQTLAIRIVRVEAGDAATLAVLDYPLPRGGARTEPAESRGAAAPGDSTELRCLREELARAQAALGAREFELTEARRVAGAQIKQSVEEQLAAVRDAWEAEVEERLALAAKRAAMELEKNRGQWRAEEEARRKTDKRPREVSPSEIADAVAKAEAQWKAAEAARLAAAEARWRQQSAKSLVDATAELERSKAKAALAESASSKRDDAELRHVRDELAKARISLSERDSELARARSEAESASSKSDDAELRHVRDELAKARISLSERDGELARARSEAEFLRSDKARLGKLNDELSKSKTSQVDREVEAARARADADALRAELEKAKAALADREIKSARIRTDADASRSELEKVKTALAERESELRQLLAEAETSRNGAAELQRINAELASAKASLAVRDAELARTRVMHDQARSRWQQEADTTLLEAERRWSAGEAERFASEEAKWREHSEMAIAEVVARLDQAEARALAEIEQNRNSDGEVHRLAVDLAKVKAELAERENELAQSRRAHEQARERLVEETEVALAKAQQSWKVSENERLAEARSQNEQQSALAIAEMSTQIKQLEELLTQAREHNKKLRNRGDSDDFRQLRKEFASLQALLAQRESELTQVRTNHELDRERWTTEARFAVQKADQMWQAEDAEEAERVHRFRTAAKLLRDALLVIAFLGLAMFGYYAGAAAITGHTARCRTRRTRDCNRNAAEPSRHSRRQPPSRSVIDNRGDRHNPACRQSDPPGKARQLDSRPLRQRNGQTARRLAVYVVPAGPWTNGRQ